MRYTFASILSVGLFLPLAGGQSLDNDCNGNGVVDMDDIAAGTSTDANNNGLPDECERCQSGEAFKLTATDAAAFDRYGYGTAVDGDVAAVGAPQDDDSGFDAGSVYVYRLQDGQWVAEAKLYAPDASPLDHFGWSLGLSDDILLIGAPDDDDDGLSSGSAYVFRFDGSAWGFERKLTASGALAGDRFGERVAADGNDLLVGAPGASGKAGAAYLFGFDGADWSEQLRLNAPDAAAGDEFGRDVALSGDDLLVAAPFDDDAGISSGSVYAYRRVGGVWQQAAKLTAPDAAANDLFGKRVSLANGLAVIGSPDDDDGGANSGSAYVYRFDGATWNHETKLSAFDAAAGDRFGESVACGINAILVAAPGDDEAASGAGALYVYALEGGAWVASAKLTASDAVAGDALGASLAVHGGTALAGAWQRDDDGFNSGAAYLYQGLADCNANATLDLCDIISGTSADLNGNLTPDECDPDCNNNGVPDDLDLATQTSGDCNGNGVPDECDIADGVSADCDQNGVPDECQPDSDNDGVIDACDLCPDSSPDDEVDETGCAPVEPVADLDVASDCSEEPRYERRWNVRNPNAFDVDMSWELEGSAQQGNMFVPPGKSRLVTATVEGPNRMKIRWFNHVGDEMSAVEESDGMPCDEGDSDGDGVLDADDWCPDSDEGADVDEHGCVKGQRAELCHVPPGKPGQRRLIRVGLSAVAAHLDHGDQIGGCEDDDSRRGPRTAAADEDDDEPSNEHSASESDDDWRERKGRSNESRPDRDDVDDMLESLPMGDCGAGALGVMPLTILGLTGIGRRARSRRPHGR